MDSRLSKALAMANFLALSRHQETYDKTGSDTESIDATETDSEDERPLPNPHKKAHRKRAPPQKAVESEVETDSENRNIQVNKDPTPEPAEQITAISTILKTVALDIGPVEDESLSALIEAVTDILRQFEESMQAQQHTENQPDQHRDTQADQHHDIQAEQHNDNKATEIDRAPPPLMITKPRDMHLSSELIRRYLLGDPAIKRAALTLGIDLDCRVVESLDWVRNFRVQRIHFELLGEDFDAWIAQHGKLLGVHFGIMGGTYLYRSERTKRFGYQIKRDYKCSRGQRRKDKVNKGKEGEGGGEGGERGEGGETIPRKKKRRRRVPESTGCKAEIMSVRMEKRLEDGTAVQCHHVSYMHHHNHALAIDREEDDGTQFLSVETRSTIERLLKQGASVREVLQRLQPCREEITRQGGARVFRDDIFSYADLMDVHCQMVAIEIGRDEPVMSVPEETALDEQQEFHEQAYHGDVPAFHEEVSGNPAQVCVDMHMLTDVPVRLSQTTKMTIRHSTLALLSELHSIGSISQLAEEDRDMVHYLRSVHRKLESVGITMNTHPPTG